MIQHMHVIAMEQYTEKKTVTVTLKWIVDPDTNERLSERQCDILVQLRSGYDSIDSAQTEMPEPKVVGIEHNYAGSISDDYGAGYALSSHEQPILAIGVPGLNQGDVDLLQIVVADNEVICNQVSLVSILEDEYPDFLENEFVTNLGYQIEYDENTDTWSIGYQEKVINDNVNEIVAGDNCELQDKVLLLKNDNDWFN